MKKKYLFVLMLFVFQRALALPSFDPFADATANGGTSYDTGGNLIGQNNSTLFSAWYSRGLVTGSSVQPTIVAGNLSYPGMPSSSGNSVTFVGAAAQSACLDLNLPTQHTNTVYTSFLLKLTDISSVPTSAANNPFAAFLDDPSALTNSIGRLGSRIVTKKIGNGYVLGTSKSAVTGDFIYEPDADAHNVDDVLFVVVSYQRVPNIETNVFLWINPPQSSFGSNMPPSPTLVATAGTTALNVNNARAFAILTQFTTAPSGVIDDVRIGTNWVDVTGGDPAIAQNPSNQMSPEGGSVVFTVDARGTPILTYQWFKDGTIPLSDGGNISGANTASLTINNVSAADFGAYSVFVTNGLGAFVQSGSATLSITDPAISTQPQSRTNNFGTVATFHVVAAGTGPLGYQWNKEGVGPLSDGGNISGSQTDTLTLTGVSLPDAGNYSVTVSNSLSTVQSEMAALTVKDPFIVSQPASATNVAGAAVTFHVVADGTGPLSFQWRKNGNFIFDVGNVSGTSTDTLTLSDISAADAGNYSVAVIGGFSTVEFSADATLSVISPVAITAQPVSRAVVAGTATSLSVGASGTSPSYQWQFGEVNILGATSAAYTIGNVQPEVTGNYRVIVSNALNSVTSSVAVVSIVSSLQLQPTNLVVIRIGDGAQTLALTGNSMFLDQFTPDGSYVNSVGIPDQGASATIAVGWNHVDFTTGTVSGSGLTRSLDGRYMVVAGYNVAYPHTVALNTTTAAAVPRGIGLIDSQGQYALALASTATYNNTFWRAGVTDGTNNFWGAGGNSGTYYFGFGGAAATIQTQFANVRGMGLFNGSIYLAGAVAGNNGILKLDGMPATAATPTHLFSGSTGTSEMEVSPDGNLIYVADDRAVANNGGVQRWEFNGANWTMAYTLNQGLGNSGPRYVTADFSGANPVVYAVTKETDNNHIVRIEDTGAGSLGAIVASAGANQIFRGIRMGPTVSPVAPPILSATRDGNNLILSWSGPFVLQSSTNVAGPYVTIEGAANPYPTDMGSDAQKFFRLRN